MLIVVLESQEALFQFGQAGKVVGGEYLSLNDGEVDFDLIEPTGVNWRVHEDSIRPLRAETSSGFLPPVGGAVVHDPEDAAGGPVRLLTHDLSDEAVGGSNSIFLFAAAEDLGAMDVPSRQIGPGTLTEVLVLDSPGTMRGQRQTGMFPASGLDAGFFVRRDDELVAS